MVDLIFMIFATISCSVLCSLKISRDDFDLMDYTKLISEEHFAVGHSVVTVLSHGEQDSSNNAVYYLIKELHALVRWSIVVFNARYEMEGNMLLETHKHGNYIILISGPCEDWEERTSRFRQQLSILRFGNTRQSWNPRAKFLVTIMSDCSHFDITLISRAILNEFWFHGVRNAAVFFRKSSEERGKKSQQSTSYSKQGTHLELQSWFPYENSERCDPAEGTVPVKVFTIRNLRDIRRSDVFKEHLIKNLHGCPIRVHAVVSPPFVNPPKLYSYNDSYHYNSYEDGLEIELIRIIGKSLNASVVIEDGNDTEFNNGTPYIYIGSFIPSNSFKGYEFTRSYFTIRYVWNTPCAVKYRRWNRFFNIFSADLWITLALVIALGVIIVRYISRCSQKAYLNESKSYSNILSITTNIIAVLLSVSVNTHPRTTALRVFFFSWVCFSVTISTVFQAYLTSYLVPLGYEEPLKTLDEMLKSERKFGFTQHCEIFYANNSDSVDLAILKSAVRCRDFDTCFKWAAVYHNFSTIFHDLKMVVYRELRNWKDENDRPLLCELKDGLVGKRDFVFLVNEGNPLLRYINDAIGHIVEGGIFMQLKKRYYEKEKIDSKFDFYNLDDISFYYSIKQLQTVFYHVLMGYVLALAFFMIEALWHRYRSKGHEIKVFSSHGQI
jgi:hypothetical protein